MADFTIENHVSLYLLLPHTEEARTWIATHISPDHQSWGSGIVVEHRYIWNIADGIRNDGLTIEGE